MSITRNAENVLLPQRLVKNLWPERSTAFDRQESQLQVWVSATICGQEHGQLAQSQRCFSYTMNTNLTY